MSDSNAPPPVEPLAPPAAQPLVQAASSEPLDAVAVEPLEPKSFALRLSTQDAQAEPVSVSTSSILGLADALLRAPERAMNLLSHDHAGLLKLVGLATTAAAVTGLVMASFSGGWQYLALPLKLAVLVIVGPLLCLPSLYIFSCLSESRLSVREVTIALGSGLGVQGLLLCGLAPVAWVFSQSTQSVAFMGGLYVAMFLISGRFGLALTRRLLALGGHRTGSLWIWQLLFTIVILQLTTTLRPIVGPFDGVAFHTKQFFLEHWLHCLFH